MLLGCALNSAAEPDVPSIPPTQATALDGHPVVFPRDLQGGLTVLIVGFGRHSESATTAWEKAVRTQLASPTGARFYDIAMLAEVPGFMRSLVVRAIRHEVPDVVRPNFLPLTDHEDDWKHAAGYAPDQPDAAYVLLVDAAGRIRWKTHLPFSSPQFTALKEAAQQVRETPR